MVSISSDNLNLLQICGPGRILLSNFSAEVGRPSSTSMEAIDISSSDSDVEIEVAHTDNRSQFPASSEPYRKLPPWYFNPTSNSKSESEKQATHIDTENALLSAPVSSTTHGDLPSRPHPSSSHSDSSDGEVEVVQYSGSSVPLRPHLSSSNSESRSEMGIAHINKGNAFPAAPVPSTSYRRRLPSWPDPSISNSKGKSKHILYEKKISPLHIKLIRRKHLISMLISFYSAIYLTVRFWWIKSKAARALSVCA